MSGIWRVAAALLMASTTAPSSAAPPNQPEPTIELNQFTGEWIMEENGRWTRERWGVPTATGIDGSGQSGIGAKSDFSEKMRIGNDRKGRITLWVKQGRSGSKTAFRLQPSIYGNWIFENLKHDYPQRIIYSRHGGWLFATIMTANNSKSKHFAFRRVNLPPASADNPVPNLNDVEGAVTTSRWCHDRDGFTLCLPPTATKVRNLVCWPIDDLKGYIEPYRTSPAAECSFESRTVPLGGRNILQNETNWHADRARLHLIPASECSGKSCKREWHIPAN